MKTLYLTDSMANIVVDKDTDFVGRLREEDRYDVRSVYYIEEPMHVVYQSGETKEEIDAKKGDILLLFYSNRYNKFHIDTIKTKQWASNIRNRRILEQKDKEAWAAKNAECCNKCEDCCCDCLRPINEAPVSEKSCGFKEVVNKVKKAIKKTKKS
jgi:hypothetical protein